MFQLIPDPLMQTLVNELNGGWAIADDKWPTALWRILQLCSKRTLYQVSLETPQNQLHPRRSPG